MTKPFAAIDPLATLPLDRPVLVEPLAGASDPPPGRTVRATETEAADVLATVAILSEN